MTGPRSGPALGLVYSSTRETRTQCSAVDAVKARLGAGAAHLVDRPKSRLRRMKHGVITSARLLNEACARNGFRFSPAMVTLTYAPGQVWRARHVKEFLDRARKWHKRRGVPMRYVWVAEMQERGAVHYHCIFWLPRGLHMPKPDRRGWWPCGSSKIEAARNAVGYVAKYASKGAEGPAFPRGIRIHGAGGLDPEGKRQARWWRAPSEARDALGPDADIRFIKGGRVCVRSGLFWRSPWRLVSINGARYMLQIEGNTPCN